MSEGKFTPGPWKVAEPVDGGIPAVYPDTGKMEFPIAVKPEFIRLEVWLERATLIAAAPELLEALQELHLKTVVGTDEERHAALNKAWAAISKAIPHG